MQSEFLEKAKSFLALRNQAYQQVFNPESIFTQRVLEDLARFCRAQETTFHNDPRVHAVLEGRREVWIRICRYIKLDPEQLWKIYGKDSK